LLDANASVNRDNQALVPPVRISEEQLKAFWEAVQADAGLQEKLKAAVDPDAVVSIAKAAGFVISIEDLQKAQLSEEELDGVAGGIGEIGFPCRGGAPGLCNPCRSQEIQPLC